MRRRPTFFATGLSRRQRRVYGLALLWYALVSAGMLWPLYAPMSRLRPFFLGMPWSLAYLAILLVCSFLVGLSLLRWELRQGLIDRDREDP